jgi:hypothetical protein
MPEQREERRILVEDQLGHARSHVAVCLVNGDPQRGDYCACHGIPCAFVREDAVGTLHTSCYNARNVSIALILVFIVIGALLSYCVRAAH